MLTTKAARQLLKGLAAEDDHMHCYCTSDDCDFDGNHPAEEGRGVPRFGIAFVTEDGRLDRAANQEAYGWDHGNLIQDAKDAVLELRDYAEYIDDLVVIDRETGQWWDGTEFPG